MNEEISISYAPHPFAGDLSEPPTTEPNTPQGIRAEATEDDVFEDPEDQADDDMVIPDDYYDLVVVVVCILVAIIFLIASICLFFWAAPIVVPGVLMIIFAPLYLFTINQPVWGAVCAIAYTALFVYTTSNED